MGIFVACLITIAIETLFFVIIGYRDRAFVLICVCINAATNLSLNLLVLLLARLGADVSIWVYPLEALVVLAEYLVYAALRGSSWKLLLWTLLANGLSYGAGLIIYGQI